jgi:hypothetical protein
MTPGILERASKRSAHCSKSAIQCAWPRNLASTACNRVEHELEVIEDARAEVALLDDGYVPHLMSIYFERGMKR